MTEMKQWLKAAVVTASGAAVSMVAGTAVGNLLWNRASAKAASRLAGGPKNGKRSSYRPADIAGLPAPVQRYFSFALSEGQPYIKTAQLEQAGLFRIGGAKASWRPCIATQRFTADPAGFLWDARILMAPGINVRVRDSYIQGEGAMEGRLASIFPVVNQRGTPELAAGALHRYLAEAVWLPTALLPDQGVKWEGMDNSAARATLTSCGISVSLEFEFGESGEIIRAYTPERFREVAGKGVPTPWACYYKDYARTNGVMIPHHGEVEWILPEGRTPYCRVVVRKIEYQCIGSPA